MNVDLEGDSEQGDRRAAMAMHAYYAEAKEIYPDGNPLLEWHELGETVRADWIRKIRPDLVLDRNKYGTLVAVKYCATCGDRFTLCPPDWAGGFGSDCLGEHCSSYDPRRDVAVLMDVGLPIEQGES